MNRGYTDKHPGGILNIDPQELNALLEAHGVDEHTRERVMRAIAAGASHTWSLDGAVASVTPAFEQVGSAPAWSHGSAVAWTEESEPAPVLQGSGSRFEIQSVLGEGGMGTVYRAWDHSLHRTVALKVLRESVQSPAARARFLQEARATAALEHPGIIPVHALDVLPDGRYCFAMRQIRGDTLRVVIEQLHGRAERAGRPWTLRRVLDAWQRVCEAVSYAHAQGVSHRDIKPDNIMIGPFGEVLVLDWGLAQRQDASTARSIAGTPRYMAPEQARGEADRIGPRSDVYALGLVLFEILSGQRAFPQGNSAQVLQAVQAGAPPAPPDAPEELAHLYRQATALDAEARPAHAGVLAEGMAMWLDGALRRERALEVVQEATELVGAHERLTRERGDAVAAVAALSAEIPPHASLESKRRLWAAEDRVAVLEREAERTVWRRISLLEGALTHVPDLPEALAALAAYHRQEHERAESVGDEERARGHERLLRRYDRGEHETYLAGEGHLHLQTEPPCRVSLAPWVEEDRRLVPGPARVLGTTPLHVTLPMGSYLLTLDAEGHVPVRYPVLIERQRRWDGIPPGETAPRVVRLPTTLAADECFVPPGWFGSGSRSGAAGTRAFERRWTDGWILSRHPVTNEDYLAFLDDLVARSRREDAARWLPRERGRDGLQGSANYALGDDGRHQMVPDADGDVWDLHWPVFNIDWWSASAYAAWRAERDGLPWCLPPADVWEKAARGVDERLHPWGNADNAGYANTRGSLPGRVFPSAIHDFVHDESVYGLRGMGGNVREYTATHYDPRKTGPEDERTLMGGCWFFGPYNGRLDISYAFGPRNRGDTIGFRIARPWPATA